MSFTRLVTTMEQAIASSSNDASSLPLVEVATSKHGRIPGKAHKANKSAVRRSYISPAIKSPFDKRKELEKKRQAVKDVERDMKEEAKAEAER